DDPTCWSVIPPVPVEDFGRWLLRPEIWSSSMSTRTICESGFFGRDLVLFWKIDMLFSLRRRSGCWGWRCAPRRSDTCLSGGHLFLCLPVLGGLQHHLHELILLA